MSVGFYWSFYYRSSQESGQNRNRNFKPKSALGNLELWLPYNEKPSPKSGQGIFVLSKREYIRKESSLEKCFRLSSPPESFLDVLWQRWINLFSYNNLFYNIFKLRISNKKWKYLTRWRQLKYSTIVQQHFKSKGFLVFALQKFFLTQSCKYSKRFSHFALILFFFKLLT